MFEVDFVTFIVQSYLDTLSRYMFFFFLYRFAKFICIQTIFFSVQLTLFPYGLLHACFLAIRSRPILVSLNLFQFHVRKMQTRFGDVRSQERCFVCMIISHVCRTSCPSILQHKGITAYREGWAVYTEYPLMSLDTGK